MQKLISYGNIKVFATIFIFLVLSASVIGFLSLSGSFNLPQPSAIATESGITDGDPTSIELTDFPAPTSLQTDLTESIAETAAETDAAPETAGTAARGDAGAIAGMWVDGKRVPMTYEQLAEFERKLYSSQTKAEYVAMIEAVAYYNRGVDMTRFSWYWDDLDDSYSYSDEQIAIMKSGRRDYLTMPDLYGMEIKQAYRYATDRGVLVRFFYNYNANCSLPAGYCYNQDIAAGSKIKADASVIVNVQMPGPPAMEAFIWDPDDWDFDINARHAEFLSIDKFVITIPDIIGMTAEQATQTLEAAGFQSIRVMYLDSGWGATANLCYQQMSGAGGKAFNTSEYWFCIQVPLVAMPDLVGLSEQDASAALRALGLVPVYEYVSEPGNGFDAGYCFWQEYIPGLVIGDQYILIRIQTAPTESPSTAAPTPSE